MCVMTKGNYEIIEFNFNGNRTMIQRRAAIKALDEIRKVCLKND